LTDPSEETQGSRRRRWTIALAIGAALIPIVAIVVGLSVTSGSSHTQAVAGTNAQFQSVEATTTTSSASTSATTHRHPSVLPPGHGAVVALLRHRTTMHVAPGGHVLAGVGMRTSFGSPTTFLVVRHTGRWLGVISSQSGNGRVGWVTRSSVSLTRVHWQLSVSLKAKRLTVLENGKALRHYSVAIGRPDAPTPSGRFAVTDRLATHDPAGPYGCCILALSAHSPHAIQGWSGGNRIAIHSTPDASSIGQAVSHGCVRVTLPDGRWLMSHIPLGTPAVIRG
jgi:lipoprotein-anchoring transpeptidase ErfK/SrfK